MVDLRVDNSAPQRAIDSTAISKPEYHYSAFHSLQLTVDTMSTGYKPSCEVRLQCTTKYTRLSEVLRLGDPSNPIWLLQVAAGILLILVAQHLTRNIYIRVMAGGLSGVLIMLGIVVVLLYHLTPPQLRNLGKVVWYAGAISLNVFIFSLESVKDKLKEIILIPEQPFPNFTVVGWVFIAVSIGFFIVGATMVKRYTEDVSVQQGLAWLVRVVGFVIILTGVQDQRIAMIVVVWLSLPFVLPPILWTPLNWLLFGPTRLLWWLIRVVCRNLFGWTVDCPDEIFYKGPSISAHAEPAGPPIQHSRKYLTPRQAAEQAERTTKEHQQAMFDAVRSGSTEVTQWAVENGKFVQKPNLQRNDLHHVSSTAMQRLKRHMLDSGDDADL